MIPVNLVTGFLGVGKTTCIDWLLRQHPKHQRWAVLVNEFGEVGVDGALLSESGVAVQEVAGGCLCCVAAPAFVTGLNRLIREHRPDRILIEPSGLGHPKEVLEMLKGPQYQGVLALQGTICLMDPRHLASPRHLGHDTFQDQIHLADALVANKVDLATALDMAAFERFVARLVPPKTKIGAVERGRVNPDWLDLEPDYERRAVFPDAHAFLLQTDSVDSDPDDAPMGHWVLIEGSADGYHRAGWSIHQSAPWQRERFERWWNGIACERKKAVVRTEKGWVSINQMTWSAISPPADNRTRIELIDNSAIPEEFDISLREIAGLSTGDK